MGKADYTHDYYRDLDLDPTADEADIKKQFRKLALLHHPDRNRGNEEAASKRFQQINAAAEVLLDPKERAKYDMNRIPRSTYNAGYSGASGVRGNPYADMASKTNAKYGPPPSRAPPRSKGATNYDKFARATPPQSAFQAAQEGAEARKNTYDAWERMHHPTAKADQGSFKSQRVPGEFPSSASQSFQAESASKRRPTVPPRTSVFDEYRDPNTTPRKTPNVNNSKAFPHSVNMPPPVPNRKGFMPNTPGAGDEPPAPRGAYFTQRDKPTAPPPPPRDSTSTRNTEPDPLRQFKAKTQPAPDPEVQFSMDGRTSTPYASHGGERFNPFESTNLNRSKSTRDAREASKGPIPRPGSDSDLKANRPQSSADPKPTRRASTKPSFAEPIEISSDSEDDNYPTMNASKSFGKRASGSSNTRTMPETKEYANTGKLLGKISQFRQWMQENPRQEPPPNFLPLDNPPPRTDQTNVKNNQPNMYDSLTSFYNDRFSFASYTPTSATFKQKSSSEKKPTGKYPVGISKSVNFDKVRQKVKFSDTNKASTKPAVESPSGVLDNLTEYERSLRADVRGLVGAEAIARQCPLESPKSKKRTSGDAARLDCPLSTPTVQEQNIRVDCSRLSQTMNSDSPQLGSPAKKSKMTRSSSGKMSFRTTELDISTYFSKGKVSNLANATPPRFTFNNTFDENPPRRPSGFSNSEENISTKFVAKDWDGKFSAGPSIFSPNQNDAGIGGASSGPARQRSKSTTRLRQKSPTKANQPMESPDGTKLTSEQWAQTFKPQTFVPPSAEPQQMQSPSETAFSPNVWAETFNPQTFMPPSQGPPPRVVTSKRRPSLRPTMGGKAAVLDDSSTSDEQTPHFSARKEDPRVSPAPIPTPEPMDIDTPPNVETIPKATNGTVPKFNANNLHIDAKKVKHSSSPSASRPQSSSGLADSLKVDFESLNVVDLISTLKMPEAPIAPEFPTDIAKNDRPSLGAYSAYQQLFAKYMAAWDIYNKKFLLHLVSRNNQNDALKERRWKDNEGIKIYRRGLEEDCAVLKVWMESNEKHAKALKGWQIMKERMS